MEFEKVLCLMLRHNWWTAIWVPSPCLRPSQACERSDWFPLPSAQLELHEQAASPDVTWVIKTIWNRLWFTLLSDMSWVKAGCLIFDLCTETLWDVLNIYIMWYVEGTVRVEAVCLSLEFSLISHWGTWIKKQGELKSAKNIAESIWSAGRDRPLVHSQAF